MSIDVVLTVAYRKLNLELFSKVMEWIHDMAVYNQK